MTPARIAELRDRYPDIYVTECLDAIEALQQDLAGERFHHAACLSIAEGVPGWETFKAKHEAARAVQKLRTERDRYRAALEDIASGCRLAELHDVGKIVEFCCEALTVKP